MMEEHTIGYIEYKSFNTIWPKNWVECLNQVLDDPKSIFHTQRLPNKPGMMMKIRGDD